MKDDLKISSLTSAVDRRQFLRGAAGTVGVSLLGLAPASALAQILAGGTTGVGVGSGLRPIVSVGFWDGTELVPATSLSAGDSTLESVSLTIDGRPAGSAFNSLAVKFFTDQAGTIPFTAWCSAPSGVSSVNLTVPVAGQQGLTFTTMFGGGSGASQVDTTLTMGSGAGPKLKAGTYVIALGFVPWGSFPYNPATYNGAEPGSPPFIVLTVSAQ